MRHLSWVAWPLLLVILLAPIFTFAEGGGPLAGLGAKTHVHRDRSLKTPWISGPGVLPFFFHLVRFAASQERDGRTLSIADPPFVPPEA